MKVSVMLALFGYLRPDVKLYFFFPAKSARMPTEGKRTENVQVNPASKSLPLSKDSETGPDYSN